MGSDRRSDDELLAVARGGDEAALARLVERHARGWNGSSGCGWTADFKGASILRTLCRTRTWRCAASSLSTLPTRKCRFSCGCGWRWGRSWWTFTGFTSLPRCATPLKRFRCTARPTAGDVGVAGRALDGQADDGEPRGDAVELKLRVQEAANSMDANDREVLILRHFEELSNGEARKYWASSRRRL